MKKKSRSARSKTLVSANVARSIVNQSLRERHVPLAQLKYFDTAYSGGVTTAPTYFSVSLVPQGVSQSQRIGDFIIAERFEVRGNFVQTNSDIISSTRLLLFNWLPNTAVLLPGSTSILENPGSVTINSFYNYEGRQEYIVRHDVTYRLSGLATAPTQSSNLSASFTISNIGKIVYNLAATNGTHQLYFLVLSDSAILPYPAVYLNCRLWYYDA